MTGTGGVEDAGSPPPAGPSPALLDVVRDEFGRVTYSHKTHQKMIDRLQRVVRWETRANALLLTATAANTAAVALVFQNKAWAERSAMGLSLLTLFVTVYGLSRHRDHLIDLHRRAATALWLVRERYLHLIGDLRAGSLTDAQGRAARDELARQSAQVYAGAPDTDDKAYAAAQRALKQHEELTFAPGEIDVMLPAALRSAPLPAAPDPFAGAPAWRQRIARWALGR